MSTLSGLRSAAFVNDDAQTVVRLNRAHEDTSVIVRELLQSEGNDTRGYPWFAGYQSEVEWMQPDLSDVSQMETWMREDTPVQFVAVGPEKIVQWYEPRVPKTFQSVNTSAGNVDPLHGRLTLDGGDGTDGSGNIVGFPNGSHRIYASRNALYPLAYDAGNSLIDTDNDGVPDGYNYTDRALKSEAVNSGVYEAFVDTSVATVGERGANVLLPIEGVEVTLSVEVTQLHDGGTTFIRVEALDSAGNIISNTFDTTNATTTGRISASVTTPPGTYEVRAVILGVELAATETSKAKVTKPALRVDGGTSYVTR
jgi:hypothetical protein